MRQNSFLKKSMLVVAVASLSSAVFAGDGVGNSSAPLELLVKFEISGSPSTVNPGPGVFTIGGPGYATVTTSSGEILDNIIPGLEVAVLEGAEIQLLGSPTDPVVGFTCLASSCKITLNDGTVLKSDASNLPLTGRLANVYGTMDNDEGHIPVRILGCGGLVATDGPMMGMVGSICFNGTFNVEGLAQGGNLTGGSNCTIVLHEPRPFPSQ